MTRLDLSDPLAAFRLDGEVAAVTGGGSGIGRAAAIALARVGAAVAILDRDHEAGVRVASEIASRGGTAEAHALDITDEEAVERSLAAIVGLHRRLDILVNSAGISIRGPATDLALADWETVIGINMTGSFLCARLAARHMLTAGGGRIVNIVSILGFSGGIYPNIAYQSSKGAVVNMTRALAVEWAKRGIRVNAVAPGYIWTPLTKGARQPEIRAAIEDATPMGMIGEPEDVVGAILFLASRASSYVTGHILAVDGGFLAR